MIQQGRTPISWQPTVEKKRSRKGEEEKISTEFIEQSNAYKTYEKPEKRIVAYIYSLLETHKMSGKLKAF